MPRAQERNGRAEDRVFNAILDAVLDHRMTICSHRVLSEFAGNAAFDRFMEHLICRTPLLALARTGRIAYCGAADPREGVEALARRDAAAAARRMSEHLNNVERQLGGV